jgi:integrase/recombinase XerD
MANFDVKNYEFVFTKHHQKNIIGIKFPYNQQLLAELQSKVNCRWSHSLRMWYCADDYSNRESLHLPQKSMSDRFLIDIHPNNHHAFRLYAEQLILKGYSKNTQKTYLNEFARFLKILNAVEASKLTKEQLRSYFLYCHQQLKLSFATIHSRMNAVKFYYEQILQQTIHKSEIPRPKKPSRLPKTLTKIDILKMLDLTQNLIAP